MEKATKHYPEVAQATQDALDGPPPITEEELTAEANELFAAKFGISQPRVSMYRAGVRRMSYYQAERLFYHPRASPRIRRWALGFLRSHDPEFTGEVQA